GIVGGAGGRQRGFLVVLVAQVDVVVLDESGPLAVGGRGLAPARRESAAALLEAARILLLCRLRGRRVIALGVPGVLVAHVGAGDIVPLVGSFLRHFRVVSLAPIGSRVPL